MNITLQETVQNVRPVTDELTELLVGLGFDAERLGTSMDLAIDSFDQWTNPKGVALSCLTSGMWTTSDAELEQAV
jgi:hypothetical protein